MDEELNTRKPLLLRQADIARALGASRWTVMRVMRSDPTFPRMRWVSPGVSGVLADELEAWLRSRPVVEGGRKRRAGAGGNAQ